MTDTDQLANDVDRTRESLRKDVAKLNARVSPSAAVSSRTDKIKNSANSIKNRIMGSAQAAKDAAGDKISSAPGAVKDATDGVADTVGDAAGSAPQAVRDQTAGNPIAAGMIAFGVGWLLSSLVPTTAAEQHAVEQAEQNADGLVTPLKESAAQVAGNLQQPVQDSVDALREMAGDAASRTADHARSATEDVKADARSKAEDVKADAQSRTEDVKSDVREQQR